jgi:acetyl-CoA carboxylase biotin carboxyl carrier protein
MDKKEIYELLEWFDRSTLTEIVVEKSDTRVLMKKSGALSGELSETPQIQPPRASIESPLPDEAPEKIDGIEVITAPMVGTFYRAAAADAPPFVEVGTKIKQGETICLIEAMKVMNELEAEFDCEIIKILAQNVSLVEYGTPLFEVRIDD